MKRYRIKPDVRPYPNKVFITEGEPDKDGQVHGFVRLDARRLSGLKRYHATNELTLIGEE